MTRIVLPPKVLSYQLRGGAGVGRAHMRKVAFVAGVLVLSGLGSVAFADGLRQRGLKDAPVACCFSWTGLYFGSHIGWGWGDVDLTENQRTPPVFPITLSSSHDVDGWLGGVQIGGMKQFGPWVVGVEVSLSGGNINGSGSTCLGFTAAQLGAGSSSTCESNVNWMLTALSRLGFAHDRWLIYGTAGWAIAGLDHTLTLVSAGTTLPFAQQDVADGLAIGAGVEWAVAKDFTVGLQYLHVNLDARGDGFLSGLGGFSFTGRRDLDLNTITARLNYRFGGDCNGCR